MRLKLKKGHQKMNKKETVAESPCKGFGMEIAIQAYQHMEFDVVEHYGDSCNGKYLYVFDEGRRYLARCRNCGGLILVQHSELHGPEDSIFFDFFPVSSPEEAKSWNAYDGFEIEQVFPGRYLAYTDGRLSWCTGWLNLGKNGKTGASQ